MDVIMWVEEIGSSLTVDAQIESSHITHNMEVPSVIYI